MSKEVKRRYLGLCAGMYLSVMTAVAVVYTGYYFFDTGQADARLLELPLPVRTAVAGVRVVKETIGASGSIEPSMPVTLTSKVASRVLSVPVDLGAVVRPGELLVQLDQRLFSANLESARVNYDHAHRQLGRMENLKAKKFASDVDVEKARTDDAAARDALVRAELDLANTRLLSPVPGVVLERDVNPGEVTKLDQDLIRLGVLDPVMMVAQVSEDKVGSVYLGMKAEVGTDAYPGMTFTGSVVKIDSRISDATRSFSVYIQLPNHELRLKKGITGYSRLESKRMVLAVPNSAIVDRLGGGPAVFVVGRDGRAHLRPIRPGLSSNGVTEVHGGLQEGEQVVVAGQSELHDNVEVSVNGAAAANQLSERN